MPLRNCAGSMSEMVRPVLLLLSLTLFTGAAGAEEVLRSFRLQHRTAAELAPVIEPLLGEAGAVTASGNLLVVRADEAMVEQVAALLPELDTPPVQLIITVRQAREDLATQSGGSLSGRMGTDGGGNASVRIYRNRSTDDTNTAQTIRTLEGRWASIDAGEVVPLTRHRTIIGGGIAVTEKDTQYVEATRGFRVRARLSGDRVIVELAPHSARADEQGNGRFETASATTTISAPLGEWMEIGGTTETRREEGGGITYSTESAGESESRLQMKVERIGGRP